MIILGIDPALSVTGYGVLEIEKNSLRLIEAGVIKTSSKEAITIRLEKIFLAITKLISDTKPKILVLEKLYAHYRHPVTSYLLGQARGVICLAAALKKVEVAEYAATRVKKAIVGNGLASKEQVQRMIMHMLGVKEVPAYTDVTDALALAIAHSYIARAQRR